MSSVSNDPNGRRRLLFMAPDGTRKTIRLGKCSKRDAERVAGYVDDLNTAMIRGGAMSRDTAAWLKTIGSDLHGRLSRAGLVEERAKRIGLKTWLDSVIAEKEKELKPESIRKLRQTASKLLEHFGDSRGIDQITLADAAIWRTALREAGLSEAAVKIHSGNAKTMMSPAVRRKHIEEDPFIDLPSGPTASQVDTFVTLADLEKVLAEAPGPEWKLLLGLARLAGLRVPSETHLLTVADIDFEKSRMTVASPKTERHAGHEKRLVPITPRLMELIQARYDGLEPGQRLISIRGKGAVQRLVQRMCDRANVPLWPRLWQSLRSSCERQWAMEFPQFAVSKWIGHSIVVSGRHYTNGVPDELFRKAAQIPTQTDPETDRNAPKPKKSLTPETAAIPCISSSCDNLQSCPDSSKMEPGGVEPPSKHRESPSETVVQRSGGAKSGALRAADSGRDQIDIRKSSISKGLRRSVGDDLPPGTAGRVHRAIVRMRRAARRDKGGSK